LVEKVTKPKTKSRVQCRFLLISACWLRF
jgi:hypothetical protein